MTADAEPIPADTRRKINVGLTLAHCLWRWATVTPTVIQQIVSAGVDHM